MLVVDDDVHRDRRRLMMAPFQRDAVAKQAGVMAEIAAENIAGWPVGREFPAAPRMSQLTLEVILRTVIGASDAERLAALREIMPKLLTLNAWETLAIANPKLQRRRPWRKVRDRIDAADRLLYAEIAERRADPHLAERTDALAMLIRANEDGRSLSDVELRDQLMTLLVAGHDTTATALSWTLERLTRHPQHLAKAVAAANASAAGDASGDDYLDALGKEVLRIRPVVFDVGRVLTTDTEVAGYRLPAGVMVAPGDRSDSRERRRVSRPGAVRSRPHARCLPQPDDLVAVRRRKSTVSRSDVLLGRTPGRAQGGAAQGRTGDDDRARRTSTRQGRDSGAAPRRSHSRERGSSGPAAGGVDMPCRSGPIGVLTYGRSYAPCQAELLGLFVDGELAEVLVLVPANGHDGVDRFVAEYAAHEG